MSDAPAAHPIPPALTLDQHREAFSRGRFLAMPLAGTIVWALIAIGAQFLNGGLMTLLIYIGTGCIAYLGMFLSRFTGENMLDRNRPKNPFDALFLLCAFNAVLVYAIAIPFQLIEPSSLPMTVGILTGLMWIPFGWIIQHGIGLFHTLSRTGLIVAAWYVFPAQRYWLIPVIIIAVYLVTITVLERRWRALQTQTA